MEMTRRALLGGGAAAVVLAAASSTLAQAPGPAPRVKGPRVWLDLDQAELDAAYDQSVYAPSLQQIVGRYATNSSAANALSFATLVRQAPPWMKTLIGAFGRFVV